jgi:hypothetical protein
MHPAPVGQPRIEKGIASSAPFSYASGVAGSPPLKMPFDLLAKDALRSASPCSGLLKHAAATTSAVVHHFSC